MLVPSSVVLHGKTPRATDQRRGVASVCAWLRGHGLGERTLKTAVAVTLAWAVGAHVPGGTAHPYFAPLAALLSVQSTVAESIHPALARMIYMVVCSRSAGRRVLRAATLTHRRPEASA